MSWSGMCNLKTFEFLRQSTRLLNTKCKGKTLLVKTNQFFWAETFVWFDQQCFAFTLYTLFSAQAKIQMLKTSCRKFWCKDYKNMQEIEISKFLFSLQNETANLAHISILICSNKAIMGFQCLVRFQNPWIKWVLNRLPIVQ